MMTISLSFFFFFNDPATTEISPLSLPAPLPIPLPCLVIAAETVSPPSPHLNEPKPTTILVRVVAHGSMVLGKDMGGARVTITDAASGKILAADRKSTRLNSSHLVISYAVFCLKK